MRTRLGGPQSHNPHAFDWHVACGVLLSAGSQVVHEKAPHIKSLMVTGPRGVGKKMLVHAVCTETGSNLFDLTPSTIATATRYAGKAGLAMLLHMVFKVRSYVTLPLPTKNISYEILFLDAHEKHNKQQHFNRVQVRFI